MTKTITATEYDKIMGKVIKDNAHLPPQETLVILLKEASRYNIYGDTNTKKLAKKK